MSKVKKMGLIEEKAPSSVSVAISLTSPISKNPMEFSRITLLTGTCDGSTSNLNIKIQESGSKHDDMMLQESNPDEIMSIGDASSISLPITVAFKGIDKGQIVAEVISVGKESIENAIGHTLKASMVVLADKNHRKSVRSVFELEYVPFYGFHSVCGKRPEMEDAVVAVPQFMQVPIKMFVADHVIDRVNPNLSDLTAHFFGVYDGHGGSQVFSYLSLTSFQH